MANRFWNVPLGGDLAENVTEGASDTSDFLCVRVTYDATGNSRENAIKALDAARMAILQDSWPPV